MTRLFHYADSFHIDALQYTSNVYLHYEMFSRRKGRTINIIPDLPYIEKGNNNYVSEAHLHFRYLPSGSQDCKVTAFYSTNKRIKAESFAELGRFNFFLYDSRLFSKGLLNPLHKKARTFYHYRVVSGAETERCVRVKIRPRFSNDQLVEGFADVDTLTGALRNFSFSFIYHLKHITVSGKAGRTDMRVSSRTTARHVQSPPLSKPCLRSV